MALFTAISLCSGVGMLDEGLRAEQINYAPQEMESWRYALQQHLHCLLRGQE